MTKSQLIFSRCSKSFNMKIVLLNFYLSRIESSISTMNERDSFPHFAFSLLRLVSDFDSSLKMFIFKALFNVA